jgi:uracil-DNA glycosylase
MGPIFHRGRLDGSARVLVIGQDPAQHEAITSRILVGAAGQRTQGFLAKLGIHTSYVMIDTFLYSVYGQAGGERHVEDSAIVSYRHRWLDALLADQPVEAVVALGRLADRAFHTWKATPAGQQVQVAYQHITHPTAPESSAARHPDRYDQTMAAMLANWNIALQQLKPTTMPPSQHGTSPPVSQPWMRSRAWADRRGRTADARRATIVVTVPANTRLWPTREARPTRKPQSPLLQEPGQS